MARAGTAIKTLTDKLARTIGRLLKTGGPYRDVGEHYQVEMCSAHVLKTLQKKAAFFGCHLTPAAE